MSENVILPLIVSAEAQHATPMSHGTPRLSCRCSHGHPHMSSLPRELCQAVSDGDADVRAQLFMLAHRRRCLGHLLVSRRKTGFHLILDFVTDDEYLQADHPQQCRSSKPMAKPHIDLDSLLDSRRESPIHTRRPSTLSPSAATRSGAGTRTTPGSACGIT
jgi:hypothetical protein